MTDYWIKVGNDSEAKVTCYNGDCIDKLKKYIQSELHPRFDNIPINEINIRNRNGIIIPPSTIVANLKLGDRWDNCFLVDPPLSINTQDRCINTMLEESIMTTPLPYDLELEYIFSINVSLCRGTNYDSLYYINLWNNVLMKMGNHYHIFLGLPTSSGNYNARIRKISNPSQFDFDGDELDIDIERANEVKAKYILFRLHNNMTIYLSLIRDKNNLKKLNTPILTKIPLIIYGDCCLIS
mmetsp:Transcript_18290/g.16582  ORF Transcript_18290/g.16582 Transcript_18290/m.16582 type:complete len:239 (-) Transcript_18290:35-751(-)